MKPAVRKFCLLFLSINIVFVLVFFLGLKLYTSHGQSIEIPVLVGLSFDEAQKILEEMGLEVVVADSLFDSKIQPGSVIESDPTAGIQVKFGR
ncbi:MAG: PASTA domain-containing protein, partial [Bacteroidota bacterium]